MAVVVGTSAGFVTDAPSADPSGSADNVDYRIWGNKHTSPATAIKVTEMGWYCGNATEEANFEVGIYDHHVSNNMPENLLDGASQTNAKGTGAGWKHVTGLNITISSSTIYWLGLQVDNTTTTTTLDYSGASGERQLYRNNISSLPNPFGTPSGIYNNYVDAIYAVWEAAAGGGTQLNINDAWKEIAAIKININDVWKPVTAVKININDVWKDVTIS